MGTSFAAWPGPDRGTRPAIAYASETLQAARAYEDLIGREPKESPYDFARLFAAEGRFARPRARFRFEQLKRLDPALIRLLRPGERVHYVTTGALLTVAEHFFTEWAAYYLELSIIVFTTQRLLFFGIDVRQRLRPLASQLPHAAVAGVRSTWDGYCQLRLHNGQRLNFAYVPRLDRKVLRERAAEIVAAPPPGPTPAPAGMEQLCPHCLALVPDAARVCPECGAAYRSPRVAATLSGLLPGAGHSYLGQRGFAGFAMGGAALLWLGLVIVPWLRPLVTHAPPARLGYWLLAAGVLVAVHALDAALTLHHARKGHYLVHPDA